MKKTVKISEIIEIVNRRNEFSTCNEDVRSGWNCLLEELLEKTNNYKGYSYNSIPFEEQRRTYS